MSFPITFLASGQCVDATQEIIALGVCNILGAFIQSLPVAGSFTRSAVNAASGVRTQFRGVVTSKYTEETRWNNHFLL